MRYLWMTVLIVAITGCSGGIGNMNTRSFVATPVADEIRIVIYSKEVATGTSTWRLNNDDLRIRLTTKSSNGSMLANRTKKMTPNDYNWVVYNLEQANFTKARSIPGRRQSQGNETLTVITQGNKYSYSQNSSTRFPNGFQKVVSVIPGFTNRR